MNSSQPAVKRLKAWWWWLVARPVFSWPTGAFFHLWASAVARSCNITVDGPGHAYPGPAVYVMWHKYLPLLIMHHGRFGRWIMVHPANHVQPIADWCRIAGLKLARGGGHGGRASLMQLKAALADGGQAVMTVDGPRGPAFVAKRGCVFLAKAVQVPIIPVAYACRTGRTYPRWDSLMRPVFGDEISIRLGAPINVRPDDQDEDVLAVITDALNGLFAGPPAVQEHRSAS